MITLLALILCAVILICAVIADGLIILGICLTIIMSPLILIQKLGRRK